MKHYVRLSNCTPGFLIADAGSSLEDDAGTMTDYDAMLLDRTNYSYNCYHFSADSLGSALAKLVQDSSLPRSDFVRPAAVRIQPSITNLLASEDTEIEYSALLPPLAVLDWDFTL